MTQPAPAIAATTVVKVGQTAGGAAGTSFNPASTTIQPGDTVRWEWFEGAHDVQSAVGPVYSSGAKGGFNSAGQVFQFTFSTAGTYTYYCDEHAGAGDAAPDKIDQSLSGGKMVGKIVVQPAAEGTRTLLAQPVSFPVTTLSGFDQVVNASPQVWRAGDTTGTGAGWNVTITGAKLTSGSSAIAANRLEVQVLQASITVVSGNTPPITQAPTFTPLDTGTSIKLLSGALGAGAGSYDFRPDFRLTIPANAVAGDYVASLVVSINSGP